ncbi:MAG: arsenate reductase (glutaredoxin) [Candidatus Marinimicrobia bacterium]|mgnify:FL=1|nr:arsenate reductase (glutaredoxin) [Candidatus Neomarinimicrobiota bacterium]
MVTLLDERKVKYRKIEYLKTGFTKELILALSKKLNKKPIDFIRKNDIDVKNNLQNVGVNSDESVINLIIDYPKIIERPIVVKGGVAIIGRPVDNVLKLLN